ncbi:hypothetical protein EJ110_NYTH57803 [Nymphaea thermarum]|nr:hypothetical protein EJ110_NYTH57803 [Nymphaea thermarum]
MCSSPLRCHPFSSPLCAAAGDRGEGAEYYLAQLLETGAKLISAQGPFVGGREHSFPTSTSRSSLPCSKAVKIKPSLALRLVGRINQNNQSKHRLLFSIGNRPILLSSRKPFRVSSFKGNPSNDEPDIRTDDSRSSNSSVQLSYATQQKEEASAGSHDKQRIFSSVPFYLAVSAIYGGEVVKDLTPMWTLGPAIVFLYVKLVKGICSLYVFTFKQAILLLKRTPGFLLWLYSYIKEGKLKAKMRETFWQPVVDIKNLDYRSLVNSKVKELEVWMVEEYLDFVESIWPYYCRTIRFLKRANLI